MNTLGMLAKSQLKKMVGEVSSIFSGTRLRKIAWDIQREKHANKDYLVCLKKLLPPDMVLSADEVDGYIEEIIDGNFLEDQIQKYQILAGVAFPDTYQGKPMSAVLFCNILIKVLKPEIIVETGCASGWTSALFLEALHANQKGHLYSIDLPPEQGKYDMPYTLPDGTEQGFLIPPSLRSRWTLFSGDVRKELLPLLDTLKKVDVFYHDSDHTYQHMMWEYTSALPYLSESGVIISDDIGWNCAFSDFSHDINGKMSIHASNPNVGAVSCF